MRQANFESTQAATSDHLSPLPENAKDDVDFQDWVLPGVSRTFALTIPQLPDGLRAPVTNAYLLCRIADTIEDDDHLSPEEKDTFLETFIRSLETGRDAEVFARTVHPRLSPRTPEAERDLILETAKVVRVTSVQPVAIRRAMLRCVRKMSGGMAEFERTRGTAGLGTVGQLEDYCYFVAGVVGEMLTELFCDYSPAIEARREELEARAVSFGLGLQMTNILKDVWDDLQRGVCWLPRDVFEGHGYDLGSLDPYHNGNGSAFAKGMQDLVGVAHGHLRKALEYTLIIPSGETGIRRFLIWAVLLATSTLRNISTAPLFTEGEQVKVSRRKVKTLVALSSASIRSDIGLTALFNTTARGLTLAEPPAQRAGSREI